MAWWGAAAALGALLVNLAETPVADEVREFDVRIHRAYDARAVQRALAGAVDRLADGECQQILTDFHDAEGRPLSERLGALGRSPQQQLKAIIFHDGFGTGQCRRRSVWASTWPGGQVVFVCSPQFAEQAAHEPFDAEAVLIHEMLHTLGLRENPPSPGDITNDVIRRCYPERTRFSAERAPR